MEQSTIASHIEKHFKSVSKRTLIVVAVLFVIVTLLNIIAVYQDSHLARAIALRTYYLPVLYAAIAGGFLPGAICGIISAGAHVGIMMEIGHDHAGLLQVEHIVELPFLIIAGSIVGILRDHEQHEQEKRTEVTNLFGSYVSPQLVDEILGDKVELEGTEAEATILFADLRDFTVLSETATPSMLLRYINAFFSEMVEAVLNHNGLVNKFVGDALLTVFGVPIRTHDDAVRAVQCSIEMHQRLDALNLKNTFDGHNLKMSVGLNTGVVVAGNVGHTRRMEYTVLGDNVNLSSRIQSLNSTYGSGILISDTTYDLIREKQMEVLSREVDTVRVKGRKRACVLYEIYDCCSAEEIELKQKTLSDYARGLEFYKNGDWEPAADAFSSVLREYAADSISKIYLDRIEYFKENRPENWDGIFNYKTK